MMMMMMMMMGPLRAVLLIMVMMRMMPGPLLPVLLLVKVLVVLLLALPVIALPVPVHAVHVVVAGAAAPAPVASPCHGRWPENAGSRAALPTPSCLLTECTAITRLRPLWYEQPFTPFQKTAAFAVPLGPSIRRWRNLASCWPFGARCMKMTWVQGSLLLPTIKSRNEASTSFRGALFNR